MVKKLLPAPPEPKTVTITIKVRQSTVKALDVAAKDNGRTRSAFVGELTEIWLREAGYLNK